MIKKVLITGASGFIGRHCLPRLVAQNYEVHAIYSRTMIDTVEKIHWHQINLSDSQQLAALVETIAPSHLLHFAWYAIPGKYWASPENFRWVQASLALLEHFARVGGQRVVMAGSCAEYDWRYGYCSEQITPLLPTTIYGTCKQALQTMVTAYCAEFGLSCAWGRIFFPYGPGEYPTRLVPSVILPLLKGKPARCSHGEQLRDFLYVQEVANAFVALLESEVSGAVNIASGQPIAVKTIVTKIADLLDGRDLVQLGALPLAENEPPLLVADVTRLTKELAWQPQQDLDHYLEQTVNYWKQQLLDKTI